MPNTAPETPSGPETGQNPGKTPLYARSSEGEKNGHQKIGGTPLSVAVGVLRQGEQVLLEQRLDKAHQGGLWAFPGGKVEAGETPVEALVREFREETGLETENWQPLIEIPWDYAAYSVRLQVFHTHQFSGTPQAHAAQALVWRDIAELRALPMPPANRGVVAALHLPPRLAITGRFSSPDALYEQVIHLLNQGHRLILWRAPWLSRGEYVHHARQLVDLAHRHGAQLLLHGDPSLLNTLPQADGIHLPGRFLPHLSKHRWLPVDKWLGVSCHHQQDLQQAAVGQADYALLSPILQTTSHPEATPLGWEKAAKMVARAPLPVYALGGVGDAALALAQQYGFQGVAGISAWWSAR